MDRLTREQLLEARLNALERRIEQLEIWTGADEDGDWGADETSVAEQLVVHDKIITNLLRYLETIVPAFSIADLRRGLHKIEDLTRGDVAEAAGMSEADAQYWHERMRRIIDAHLPVSHHDPQPAERTGTPDKSRLRLVETAPENGHSPPEDAL